MIRSMTRSTLENKVNYRSLLAGNTAFSPFFPAYDLLETTVLGSDTSSVSFTSLNSTYGTDYKHLQLRITTRSGRSSTADGMAVQLNGANGNYEHQLEGNGSTVTSSARSGQFDPIIAANSLPSGEFSGTILDILNAFGSTNKTMRALSGASGNNIQLTSGLYIDTNPVDSLNFFAFGGNLLAGSRFSLYGLKAGA